MPSFVCVIECQAADDSVAGALEDLAGEHVYELETDGRDQAEREALDHFFTSHPELQRFGDRIDVAVTVRRKRQEAKALAGPRRGRLAPREESGDSSRDADARDRFHDDEGD